VTSATAQSLNLQGLNYLAKEKDHLSKEASHSRYQADLVWKIVCQLVPPGEDGRMLTSTYQAHGESIKAYNQVLTDMGDTRRDMRWIWGVGGAIIAGAGVASLIKRPGTSSIIGGGLMGAGIAGLVAYGVMRSRDALQAARGMRWL